MDSQTLDDRWPAKGILAEDHEPAPVAPQIPRATYRLQFNRDFTFAQAAELVPYLHRLGISHCYASPYLKARPGSLHGYDIIDHTSLNPEIGSPKEFERFVETLRHHRMGQILDMVPNHMGVMGSDNAWWLDVLENGPAATHAEFFDIDWEPVQADLHGKVLLPVLADQYGVVLERGDLRLVFDAGSGSFSVFYFAHRFPIDPREYPRLLAHRQERLAERMGPEAPQLLGLQSLSTAFGHLPARAERDSRSERNRDKEIHKDRLAELCRTYPEIAAFIEENVRELNGVSGEPESFDRLDELLDAQAYRLAHWRVAADEINYRRFFDINDLAALRMENPRVFEATHRLVFELLAQGQIDGLRIDHPDGLYDPMQYFQRLQARFTPTAAHQQASEDLACKPVYVTIEKILASYEELPADWPIYGTTGYRWANLVNGLFVDASSESKLDRIYAGFLQQRLDYDEIVYQSKKLIMRHSLASELSVLANHLNRIASAHRRTRDFTLNALRDALVEVAARFPVYRTYLSAQSSAGNQRYVDWAVSVAKKRAQSMDVSIYEFIREVLLAAGNESLPEELREAGLAFPMKFQQFTSPVMAKGLEDTAFYIYNRLVSLNEVGGDPRTFGISVAAFHHANQECARRWPHAMLATSTHDNKRSEDVRARINVLSEIPDIWRTRLRRWSRLNRRKKRIVDGAPAPSRNDEYLLYQTLLGTWPLGPLDAAGLSSYAARIEQYMLKAIREAKLQSSWLNPNEDYEAAVSGFVRALLKDPPKNRFLGDFLPLQRQIARFGIYNSLAQTLLKLTAPGVPDLYQGTELWDFSLVDPDNRRPVDYGRRGALLDELQQRFAGISPADIPSRLRPLLECVQDGRLKLYVIWRALGLREAHPPLFSRGSYIPLASSGERAEHVLSYARQHEDQTALIIVPRLWVRLLGNAQPHALGPEVWGDTRIGLPEGFAGQYCNLLSGESLRPREGPEGLYLPLAEVLAYFPLALLQQSRRPETRPVDSHRFSRTLD